MAAVRLKCISLFYFIFCCVLLVNAKNNNNNNEFVTYERIGEDSLEFIKPQEIVLLERNRRYVETAIPRLADNYYRQDVYPSKSLDKDDIDSFSRRRGRMEKLGNLALSSDELALGGVSHAAEVKKDQAVTEEVPEKPTKKATFIKKSQELSKDQTKILIPVGGHHHDDDEGIQHSDEQIESETTHSSVTKNSQQDSHQSESTTQASSTTTTTTPATHGSDTHDHLDSTDVTSNQREQNRQQHSDPGTSSQDDYAGESGSTNVSFTDADFPKDITNNTLLRNNITQKQVDHHSYYNSTFLVDSGMAKTYWIDMDNEKDVIINKMLSNNHRRAVTVKLSFDFPFYGHSIQKVTIATGGFLYTGDYIHSWLASTQYIAPLMANFDTGLSDESQVRYTDNGTSFTVEWYRVHLQDKQDAGPFTFQVTLHKNGDIVFVYKDVPILVENIEDCQHPVKVGLSDAYIMDRTVFFVRRKTIYEYHRVHFKKEDIKNWTVIYLSALPTCLSFSDCNSCVTHSDTYFVCRWCSTVNRCSSGYDRYRQEWQLQQCEHTAVNTTDSCKAINVSAMTGRQQQQIHQQGRLVDTSSTKDASNAGVNSQAATDRIMEKSAQTSHFGHSGLIGLLFFILTISGVGLWTLYAYRNPHTTSGQVLIKYRPSQWSLRRGEARYTAATIHM